MVEGEEKAHGDLKAEERALSAEEERDELEKELSSTIAALAAATTLPVKGRSANCREDPPQNT